MSDRDRPQSALLFCKRCGLETRHEWREWRPRPWLMSLICRTQWLEGWVCTRCSRRFPIWRAVKK